MALSELQVSLIALGSVGIVAVWAYNKWQERRHRKTAERVFRGEQVDVLLDAGKAPVDKAPVENEPTGKKDSGRVEPVLSASNDRSSDSLAIATAPARPIEEPPGEILDSVIESVVRLELPDLFSAQRLRDLQGRLAGRLTKPMRWVGLDEEGEWREIGPGDVAAYRHLRSGLLLANRAGSINEAELHIYFSGMRESADSLAATIEFPDVAEDLARAASLDDSCAGVDIQIAVHMMHREALAMMGRQIQEFAVAAGLDLREDGAFHRVDANGASQFTVTNLGSLPFVAAEMPSLSTHGITFWLDVPRVANAAAAFDLMIAAARQIAAGLDGVLVDDHRNPLSDAMLVDIRAKIGEIQQQMSALGISPGSTRALHLFA